MLEFASCLIGGKMPVNVFCGKVSGFLPSRQLPVQDIDGRDSSAKALLRDGAQLNFGNVEPTAMLWCEVNFKAFGQTARFMSWKSVI